MSFHICKLLIGSQGEDWIYESKDVTGPKRFAQAAQGDKSGVVIGCNTTCPENGGKTYKDCNLNTYHESHKYVKKFADDQAHWAKVFGKAYEKMLGEQFLNLVI